MSWRGNKQLTLKASRYYFGHFMKSLRNHLGRLTGADRSETGTDNNLQLVLHVGLPKAASTFMQYSVFHSTDTLEYIHARKKTPIERALIAYNRDSGAKVKRRLKLRLADLPARNVLISNESICMKPWEPWLDQGPTPESFCAGLYLLEKYGREVRVIIVIRRQDQWLASRYAESAKTDESFSTEDFERRVNDLCERSSDLGALKWLDYSDMLNRLQQRLGEQNLLVLPMERIVRDHHGLIAELEAFLGVSGWTAFYEKQGIVKKKNALSLGENVWRMRRRETTLSLSEETQKRILSKYESTNRKASDDFGLELGRFGYF